METGEGTACRRRGGNLAARPIFHFLISIFSVVLAAACAAPSEPTARHAPTPQAVTDLAAVQQGHRVILTFTLPRKTTDSKPLLAEPSVEIYRQTVPTGAKVIAPAKFAVNPPLSPSELAVTIPSAMLKNYAEDHQFRFPLELKGAFIAEPPGEQTVFVVRTRVNEKKDSADSNPVLLHIYEPFPPMKISAKVTHDAIILSGWAVALPMHLGTEKNSEESAILDAHYRIYRGEGTPSAPESQPPAPGQTPAPPQLELVADLPLTTMTYEDSNFTFDHTYYYVERTAAKYGDTWIESDESNLLTVTPKDIFPPAAPQGLVIVYVPAAADVPAHLEISWSISPETDLAGYDLYRQEQGQEAGQKLNARPLLTPSYRDMNVQPGRSYIYTVRAVDRAGNESPASEPASAIMPAAEQNGNPEP